MMHSVAILSALLAVGTAVVSGATTCTDDIKITQATPVIDCDVVDAEITVDENLSGSLSIEGPKQLKKSLTISNATKLIGISSSSINSVGGTLKLDGLQLLSTFSMISLKSVSHLELVNLPQLSGLTLGSEGVTKTESIIIADTFISDLSGLNVAQAKTIDISNNFKLTMFNSALTNVTKTLKLTNNGNNMQVNMSVLESAGDVQFRQVKSFDAPVLSEVESIKFNDSPELISVSADNLTAISSSLTFINNKKLSKLSFKQLKTIKGDMTVMNNTALKELDGFPKLETVGNMLLRGNFEDVKIEKLKDVKGSATAASTTDISTFCNFFGKLKNDGAIRGKESCTSNNKNANEGGAGGQSKSQKEDAAGIVSVNMALLGLAIFAGLAHML